MVLVCTERWIGISGNSLSANRINPGSDMMNASGFASAKKASDFLKDSTLRFWGRMLAVIKKFFPKTVPTCPQGKFGDTGINGVRSVSKGVF